MFPKIVALAGVSRCGKDTFATYLNKLRPGAIRISVGDIIREDCKDFIKLKTGIDPCSCSAIEKELIRPILVGYGVAMRNISEGKYFRNKLEEKIAVLSKNCDSTNYFLLTDMRFSEYDYDEPEWVKDHDGVIVHISRYSVGYVTGVGVRTLPVVPINSEEAENDPILKLKADYKIDWETVSDRTPDEQERYYCSYATNFLDFLSEKYTSGKTLN